jgi:hypothetical protein
MTDTRAGPAPVTIELGELGAADELWFEPEPRNHRPGRPSVSLCVVALLVFTLVGSVAKPNLTSLGSFRADPGGFAVSGDTVYTVSGVDLAAYGTADQTARWRMEAPRPYRDLTTAGDAVVVSGGECPGIVDSMVSVIDPRGVVRWQGAGRLVGVVSAGSAPGRREIVVERAAVGARCATSAPTSAIEAVVETIDLGNGRSVSSFRRPANSAVYGITDVNGLLTGVVTLAVDGTAEVRGADLGAVRVTGTVPGLRRGTGRSLFSSQLIASGGTLVVADGRTGALAGYDLRTLRPRWITPGTPTQRVFPLNYFGCGGVICVWTPAELGGGAFLPGTLGSRSRIRPGLSNQRLVVVDPDTGAVLRRLGGYQLQANAGGALLLSWPVGDRDTSLGWYDPRTGRMRLLTTGPDRYQTCGVGERRLACTTAAGALRVWRTDM